MRNNVITDSGKVGILFRNDTRGNDFWANRNLLENNRILNSGDENGIAIDITGQTKDVRISNNEIVETRDPMNRVGIRIGQDSSKIHLAGNQIKGFTQAILDQRKG